MKRALTLPAPIDLRATMGKAKGSPRGIGLRAAAQETHRSALTPQGAVTMTIHVTGAEVAAEAWGPGSSWALDHLADLLGVRDDPATFTTHHRIVDELHRRHQGLRIGRTGMVWPSLPGVIFGQKVTTKEANRSLSRFVRRYGEKAPGPFDLWVVPTAETVASLSYVDFHTLGVERRRAETLIGAARVAGRLEEALTMRRDNAYRRLMAVPGIGMWTAALVLAEAMGDADAVPVGDYHVKNAVSWGLAGEPRGSDDRMLDLLEPYRGHRQRVIRLLTLGGVSAPKYGPKTAPRDIAAI